MKLLRKIQKRAYLKFYLRPSYLIRQVPQDGLILFRTVLGVSKQILSKQTNGNTNYNKSNVNHSK